MFNIFLRFWLWIAGFLSVVILIICIADQEHRATEKYKRHRAEYCAANFDTPQKQEACKEEKTNPQDFMQWEIELFSWPIGITTWAIILTLFVIAWQSNETRKAADASAASARVADRAHNVQRNKDRPRVSIIVEDTRLEETSPYILIRVRFSCPTSAWVKSIHRTATIRRSKENADEIVAGDKVRGLHWVDSPAIYTEDHDEIVQIPITGIDGAHGVSDSTVQQFNKGELVIVLCVRIFFDDVYGWRDFLHTDICEASMLRTLGGGQWRNWKKGAPDMNWDQQQS